MRLCRYIAMLLAVVAVFCGFPGEAQTPTPNFDANQDGVVDAKDLLLFQQYWHSGQAVTPSATPTPTLTPTITLTPTVTLTATPTPTSGTPDNPLVVTLPGNVLMEFILIPAGSFLMGSSDVYPWANYQFVQGKDTPVHEVTIAYDFYMQKTELTQAQWMAVAGPDSNPSQFKRGGDYPVENVSWDDCMVFIGMLNELGLGTFRLPSEAEWEYACRGPASHPYRYSRYFFGPNICEPTGCISCELDNYAWWCPNRSGTPSLVARLQPNPYGLYDLLGNVYEWCQDLWNRDYIGAPNDGSAWETGTPDWRVTRGAARVYNDAREFRSSRRISHPQGLRHGSIGFRLVREVQ